MRLKSGSLTVFIFPSGRLTLAVSSCYRTCRY